MPTTTARFTVADFAPLDYQSPVTTGVSVGIATMVKTFTGAIDGRSITQFTFAYAEETGIGTYVAMESFEGTVDGRSGTMNFAHTATTTGADRTDELLTIVPTSGTGELAGIVGSGSITVDDEGDALHLNYSLPA